MATINSTSIMPGPSVSQLPCSSRIGSVNSPCCIYRHDDMVGSTTEHHAQQLCTADGRLFIEHIPNHSIVYIPLSSSIDQVLCDLRKPRSYSKTNQHAHKSSHNQQVQGQQTSQPPQPQPQQQQQASQQQQQQQTQQPRKHKEKSAKPINAFIKYRSYKIAELKRLHPEVSQTDISRLAGEYWKAESEEVKNQFRYQYREEKKVYDMKKAINASNANKRSRDSSSDTLSEPDAKLDKCSSQSTVSSAPLPEECMSSFDLPTGFDSSRRRRSLTMPPNTMTPNQRATSASPLMVSQQQQRQPNAKRRRCVTVELRKQLAAKSSLLATPPMHPSSMVNATASYSMPEIARAQSMGLEDTMGQVSQQATPDYNSMCYYGALSLASSISHASPQLLDLTNSVNVSNSPYLDDMSAMAPLPIAQTFSMPTVAPQQTEATPSLSVDTSFVSTSEDPAANSAFELYTTASDHDELASSLVSASLVAASLSSLMASSQPVASDSIPASTVTTAAPIAAEPTLSTSQ
ncbi:hypothetical protein IWW36_004790 [Coemansia brasiliensis]|uniref:HMG box domain-containing protein n=1 Tax=Coemansia brasiliensis TaxID=2650707 RepID=A0A9W8I590_9FUNG|nr:hypothetical protein IWW36_004790 [Coemansia brasiliensis]